MHGRGRYGNVTKTVIDSITFDSTREGTRYVELKLLERAGEITDLELQPCIPIEIAGVKILMKSKRYSNGRQLVYRADFRYYDCQDERYIIEDVKMQSGHRTEVFKIKRALVEAMGLDIRET